MPTTTKKSSTKRPSKASLASSKSHAGHPSWVDMIKECIIAHPEDVRAGVSRPTIKKFVESKYHINLNAAAASQLNRAITSGSEKGVFLLPKGPSGKIKLSPKVRVDAYKENTKPATKKNVVASKPSTATKVKRPAGKGPTIKKGSSTVAKKSNSGTVMKKSAAKKVPVAKKPATIKKSSALKKTSTAKKSPAKKAITGEGKKVKVKPASGTVKARASTSNSKAKPASKSKPASKGLPAP